MKKNVAFFFFLALIWCVNPLFAETPCECGSHATGITAYYVDGGDCCLNVPGAAAYIHTYEEQHPGVWVRVGSELITGAAAQAGCCPNT